jgi:hypothetical protein
MNIIADNLARIAEFIAVLAGESLEDESAATAGRNAVARPGCDKIYRLAS